MKANIFALLSVVCVFRTSSVVQSATTTTTTIDTASTTPTVTPTTQTTTAQAITTLTTSPLTATNDVISSTVVTQTPSTITTGTGTTQNATITSTVMSTTTNGIVSCRNGSCEGNGTSCIDTLVDTCDLTGTMQCYQIVQTNGSDVTYFEVGCTDDCEYLEETADDITRVTRCCDTSLCTDELLEDPHNAANSRYSCWILFLACFYITSLENIYLTSA